MPEKNPVLDTVREANKILAAGELTDETRSRVQAKLAVAISLLALRDLAADAEAAATAELAGGLTDVIEQLLTTFARVQGAYFELGAKVGAIAGDEQVAEQIAAAVEGVDAILIQTQGVVHSARQWLAKRNGA